MLISIRNPLFYDILCWVPDATIVTFQKVISGHFGSLYHVLWKSTLSLEADKHEEPERHFKHCILLVQSVYYISREIVFVLRDVHVW